MVNNALAILAHKLYLQKNITETIMNKIELKESVKSYGRILREIKQMRKPKNYTIDGFIEKLREFGNIGMIDSYTEEQLEALRSDTSWGTYKKDAGYRAYEVYSNINWIGFNLRLLHIAYSLWKGRTYEQIETPKEINALNKSDWERITELAKLFPTKEEPVI